MCAQGTPRTKSPTGSRAPIIRVDDAADLVDIELNVWNQSVVCPFGHDERKVKVKLTIMNHCPV